MSRLSSRGPSASSCALLALFAVFGTARADEQVLNRLSRVEVREADSATEMVVTGSRPPTFTVFKLSDPIRLFVDVSNADVSALSEPVDVNNGVISEVTPLQFNDEVVNVGRLIVGLEVDALYSVRASGNQLIIRVDGGQRRVARAADAGVEVADARVNEAVAKVTEAEARAKAAEERAQLAEARAKQAEAVQVNVLATAAERETAAREAAEAAEARTLAAQAQLEAAEARLQAARGTSDDRIREAEARAREAEEAAAAAKQEAARLAEAKQSTDREQAETRAREAELRANQAEARAREAEAAAASAQALAEQRMREAESAAALAKATAASRGQEAAQANQAREDAERRALEADERARRAEADAQLAKAEAERNRKDLEVAGRDLTAAQQRAQLAEAQAEKARKEASRRTKELEKSTASADAEKRARDAERRALAAEEAAAKARAEAQASARSAALVAERAREDAERRAKDAEARLAEAEAAAATARADARAARKDNRASADERARKAELDAETARAEASRSAKEAAEAKDKASRAVAQAEAARKDAELRAATAEGKLAAATAAAEERTRQAEAMAKDARVLADQRAREAEQATAARAQAEARTRDAVDKAEARAREALAREAEARAQAAAVMARSDAQAREAEAKVRVAEAAQARASAEADARGREAAIALAAQKAAESRAQEAEKRADGQPSSDAQVRAEAAEARARTLAARAAEAEARAKVAEAEQERLRQQGLEAQVQVKRLEAAQAQLATDLNAARRTNDAERTRALEAEQRAASAELVAEKARVAQLESAKAAAVFEQKQVALSAQLDSAKAQERDEEVKRLKGELARVKGEGDALKAQLTQRDRELASARDDAEKSRTEAERFKSQARPVSVAKARVTDVRFENSAEGSRVVVSVEGQATHRLLREGERTRILEVDSALIDPAIERSLDTSEFPSAVQLVSSFQAPPPGDRVRIVVTLGRDVRDEVERQGSRLVWKFAAPNRSPAVASLPAPSWAASPEPVAYEAPKAAPYVTMAQATRRSKPSSDSIDGRRKRYRGRKINIDIKDGDIHNVLRLLAKEGNVNIVTSDDVSGAVTLHLKMVPWDQVLEIVLRSKGLDMVKEGDIIRVAPAESIALERDAELKKLEVKEKLKPLEVRLVTINHAAAADLLQRVMSVLSGRGKAEFDARTNTIIINDVADNLDAAEDMIRRLDTQTPQVLIEARIIEVNTTTAQQFGIQWGGNMFMGGSQGNATGLRFPSSVGIAGAATDSNTPVAGTASSPNFAVNLPAAVGTGAGGGIGMTFGSIDSTYNLNVRLTALESHGTVKIVSQPKITTLDNSEATISQGVSIPISQVSAAGVQTTFYDAVLRLTVRPTVTQDGNIYLRIRAENNTPDFQNVGARGDPTILKKEAQTQLLVRDGDTTVIGGIYTSNAGFSRAEVPYLARIPVLGVLFRSHQESERRTELLIFVTPHIVNRSAATVRTAR